MADELEAPQEPKPRWYTSPLLWGLFSLATWCLLLPSVVAVGLGIRDLLRHRKPDAHGVGACVTGIVFGLIGLGTVTSLALGVRTYYALSGPVHPASYDYRSAKANHPTQLHRHEPAPQECDEEPPPNWVQVVKYPSEGRSLLAWLVMPDDPAPPVPAVVYLHGGFALNAPDLSDARSFYNHGFAVLMPTYRGENGNPGDHERFYGEVSDAANAVRWLATDKRIDASRIHAFGHSAGGTIAALLALEEDIPLATTGSSNGLYPPDLFVQSDQNVPFSTFSEKERDLRTPLRFAHQFLRPHHGYVGSEDWIATKLDRFEPVRAAAPQLTVTTVAGDHQTSLPPAVTLFLREIADESDFDQQRVATQLRSADPDEREQAREALASRRLPLTAGQLRALHAVLPKVAGYDAVEQPSGDDCARSIIASVASDLTLDEALQLDAYWKRFGPEARSGVYTALAERDEMAALEQLVQLATAERREGTRLPTRELAQWNTELLFPRLFQLDPANPLVLDVLRVVLEQCTKVRETPAATAPGERLMLAYYAWLERTGAADGDQVPDEDSGFRRYAAGITLDALGCLTGPSARSLEVLERAQRGDDLRLAFHATRALMEHGKLAGEATRQRLANADETRSLLCGLYDAKGRLDLLPGSARTVEALARSHLAHWLAHPAELGHYPEELVAVARVQRGSDLYVVLRFPAVSSRRRRELVAGIAGPYAFGPLQCTSPPDVFSRFEPFGSRTPREHVEASLQTLQELREEE